MRSQIKQNARLLLQAKDEGELGRNESIEVTQEKRGAVVGIRHELEFVWMREHVE
jgi:hypothetical protein